MNRLCLTIAAAVLIVAGCQENASDTKSKSSTGDATAVKSDSQTAKSMRSVAAPISYREVVKGNNLYVAGSKQAADRANAPSPTGFAASDLTDEFGRKVYFDTENQAALKTEYDKLHKKK
jgi:hypothetical protein